MTTIVRVERVSKRFVLHKDKSLKERLLYLRHTKQRREDFWALRDIDLEVASGSTLGLVGHNGSGKSTLLKLIGGIIEPTHGTVARRGRLAALLELGAGFHPDLTGRENVFLNAAILGLTRRGTERHFDSIVEFAEIADFIDTQVKFYSSGMYVRLAFAVAVHVDPDLLLVDEVLAVGDEPFQRKCLDKIAEFQREGRTIVLVSHSTEQVGTLCDRVVVLEHGTMRYDGDVATGLRELRASFSAARSLSAQQSGSPVVVEEFAAKESDDDEPSVTFRLTFTIAEEVAPWAIGLAVETPTGLPVYRMSTEDIQLALPTAPGRYDVEVTWSDINLGGGQYSVSLGLRQIDGPTLQVINPAGVFNVRERGIGRGLIRFGVTGIVSGSNDVKGST